MKCVRLNNGEIHRVSNEEASKIVRLGNGNYCPKSIYKEIRQKKGRRNGR